MTTRHPTPRYKACDRCGRNDHKVAVWYPATSTWNGKPVASHTTGYCPSCLPETIKAGAELVYDRRGDRSKAAKPLVIAEPEQA